MKTVNLLGPLDWATTPVPLGTPDVQIARLRVDPLTKASTSLVRFPAGWTRSVDVFYAVDEELVVIEGELIVSGVSYTAGQYGFIPAGSLRRMSATPTGCLALAHFAGIPAALTQEQAASHDVGPTLRLDLALHGAGTEQTPNGTGRALRTRSYGSAYLIDGGVSSLDGLSELLDTTTWDWTDVRAENEPDDAGTAATTLLHRTPNRTLIRS
jgi:Domain of unknown function (DUF4437)